MLRTVGEKALRLNTHLTPENYTIEVHIGSWCPAHRWPKFLEGGPK